MLVISNQLLQHLTILKRGLIGAKVSLDHTFLYVTLHSLPRHRHFSLLDWSLVEPYIRNTRRHTSHQVTSLISLLCNWGSTWHLLPLFLVETIHTQYQAAQFSSDYQPYLPAVQLRWHMAPFAPLPGGDHSYTIPGGTILVRLPALSPCCATEVAHGTFCPYSWWRPFIHNTRRHNSRQTTSLISLLCNWGVTWHLLPLFLVETIHITRRHNSRQTTSLISLLCNWGGTWHLLPIFLVETIHTQYQAAQFSSSHQPYLPAVQLRWHMAPFAPLPGGDDTHYKEAQFSSDYQPYLPAVQLRRHTAPFAPLPGGDHSYTIPGGTILIKSPALSPCCATEVAHGTFCPSSWWRRYTIPGGTILITLPALSPCCATEAAHGTFCPSSWWRPFIHNTRRHNSHQVTSLISLLCNWGGTWHLLPLFLVETIHITRRHNSHQTTSLISLLCNWGGTRHLLPLFLVETIHTQYQAAQFSSDYQPYLPAVQLRWHMAPFAHLPGGDHSYTIPGGTILIKSPALSPCCATEVAHGTFCPFSWWRRYTLQGGTILIRLPALSPCCATEAAHGTFCPSSWWRPFIHNTRRHNSRQTTSLISLLCNWDGTRHLLPLFLVETIHITRRHNSHQTTCLISMLCNLHYNMCPLSSKCSQCKMFFKHWRYMYIYIRYIYMCSLWKGFEGRCVDVACIFNMFMSMEGTSISGSFMEPYMATIKKCFVCSDDLENASI